MKRLQIKVTTVPNGYTLDINRGGQRSGHMYYDEMSLVRGVLYHVGMDETSDAEVAEIEGTIGMAKYYVANRDAIKNAHKISVENDRLKKQVERLKNILKKHGIKSNNHEETERD